MYGQIKSKINFLKDRFIQDNSKKCLFIIANRFTQDISLETLVYLRDSLINFRNGNKEFAILYLSETITSQNYENIFTINFRDQKQAWDQRFTSNLLKIISKEILDQFKFTPDIWA